MVYVRVDRTPKRHLLHHEQGWYVEQQRLDPGEDVRPQAPFGGMNGRGVVPCGVDSEQDAQQAGGGQAQSEIAPGFSPELAERVSCSSGTDDRRERVEP